MVVSSEIIIRLSATEAESLATALNVYKENAPELIGKLITAIERELDEI